MLLQAQALSISFGGLKAVQDVSRRCQPAASARWSVPTARARPRCSDCCRVFCARTRARCCSTAGTSPAWRRSAARLGMARTFQIVQPFGAQTVRENIAVGAHLRLPGRADALAAEAIARRVNLGAQLDKPAADLTVCGRKRRSWRARWPPGPGCCCWTRCWRAEPGRDRRDDSRGAPAGGGWRDRADDRARDARGHEPAAQVWCWRRAGSSPRARRRR